MPLLNTLASNAVYGNGQHSIQKHSHTMGNFSSWAFVMIICSSEHINHLSILSMMFLQFFSHSHSVSLFTRFSLLNFMTYFWFVCRFPSMMLLVKWQWCNDFALVTFVRISYFYFSSVQQRKRNFWIYLENFRYCFEPRHRQIFCLFSIIRWAGLQQNRM